ncbi:MAG TPA: hypothetical protein PLS69_12240 [Terricaulis sp.]|nr:hypothetical protein [Terricaulis sp.]
MIRVIAQSDFYTPEAVKARYVRFDRSEGVFRFCDVGADRRYDLRQGIVSECMLPADVASAARERAGYYPAYVAWPL